MNQDETMPADWEDAKGQTLRPKEDLTDQVLSGKYRVRRLLGRGGFGSVYEAVDEMLGAPVAVKVLNPDAASHDEALERFLGEAKLLTNLDHPNIVRWITFDKTSQGVHYFVMEYLNGEELSGLLKREGQISPDRTVEMLLQIVSALRAAHRLPDGTSLLHLDLKPQNVFVVSGEPERMKVIDFGISQHVGAEARAAAGIQTLPAVEKFGKADLGQTITQLLPSSPAEEGTPVERARGGTLLYASPEQCRHLTLEPDIVELDGRSDLYSLGIMAFQMLTGEFPYGNPATPQEAVTGHLERPPRKLSALGVKVSSKLAAFVDRCLEKDRDDRFKDADEAHAALDRIANPPALWPKLVTAAALAAVVTLWLVLPDPELTPFDVTTDNGSVFFGPEQRTLSLDVANLAEVRSSARVQIIKDPQLPEELALPGWGAEIVEGGGGPRIEVTVPPAFNGTVDERVYLHVSGGGQPQSSNPFDVVFLGDSAWRLEAQETGVRGLAGRVLDPVGAELEVVLQGDEKYIETVTVTLDDATLNAVLDRSVSAGERLLYTVQLDRFEGLSRAGVRPASFEVEVVDRAGRGQIHRLDLELDARPLEIITAELTQCPRAGPGEYVVYPTTDPIFEIEANREIVWVLEATDQDGNALSIGQQVTMEGTRLAFPDLGIAYTGEIRVSVDDSRNVLHAQPGRGQGLVPLRFQYQILPPVLNVQPVGLEDIGNPGEPESPKLYFTNRDELDLSLLRNDVQVSVEVVCWNDGSDPIRASLDLHLNTDSDQISFPLPADGLYRFAVRAFRFAGEGLDRPEEPEYQHEFLVIRDTSAPEVRLTGPEETVLLEGEEAEWQLELFVKDESANADHSTPISLDWRVIRDSALVKNGPMTGVEVPFADSTVISWSDLPLDPAELADGTYDLLLTGNDAAGNPLAAQAVYRWEVSRDGPTLELANPVGSRWVPSSGNVFQLVVRAEDANGVVSVTCTPRNDLGNTLAPLVLQRTSSDPSDVQWETRFEMPNSWSQRRIDLTVVAADAYGNHASIDVPAVDIDAFDAVRPGRIGVLMKVAPAIEIAPMRLVEGANYTYSGRPQQEEEATFAEYGLQYRGPSRVQYVQVEDFYLDETEVTVSQYLAFLAAEDGYSDLRNWQGGVPTESRRVELRERLQAAPRDDLPVTGVDGHEAAAYASWVGKRLPRLWEWEYAVRGGAAYRPFSSARGGQAPNPDTFNVDMAIAGGREPWPVGQGSDVTPPGVGEGIFDLCSNVSEWTAAPNGAGFYAAGASFDRTGAYHFNIVIPRDAGTRSESLGFRCALDVVTVDSAREGDPQSRIRVETQETSRNGGLR